MLSTELGSTGNRTASQKKEAAEQAGELIKSFSPHDIICFTDGACFGNPGPCGAGAYLKFPDGEAKKSAALRQASNNVGRLYAVVMAMVLIMESKTQGRRLPPEAKIQVLTDSKYTKEMLALQHNASANVELIASVQGKLAEVCKYNQVFIHWVGGHTGKTGNEQADQLITQGAKNSKAKR